MFTNIFSSVTSFVSKYLVIGLSILVAILIASFTAYWFYSQGKIEKLNTDLGAANITIATQEKTIKDMTDNIQKQALLNDHFNQMMDSINTNYGQDIQGIDSMLFDPVDSNSLTVSLNLKTNQLFRDIENIAKTHSKVQTMPTKEK